MNHNNKLLFIKNLTKIFSAGSFLFKSNIVAVNNVSLELNAQRAEIFTLAGESGSGKTTLARIILGLVRPTSGTILYKGRDITQIKSAKDWKWFTREVQPISQNPFDTFSPLNKVETYLYDTAINYNIVTNKSEVYNILDEKLKAVGLSWDEVRGKYPNEFSGGQLQRLSIARAIITNPSLIVADEPVSMIDASLRMSIVNLFKNLKEQFNVSVIYITHDLATAYYISDRIAIMLRGSIVESGPVEKVLNAPLHPYTKLLKQSIPEPTIDVQWEEEIQLSVTEIKEFTASGCKFAARCPYVMETCKTKEPEETFVDERAVKCYLYK
ncbi:MAG TPA: ABC transporter ATP-binding protein [bacterium]|nr:ABC transporter ATP-binding protein [bacterium]